MRDYANMDGKKVKRIMRGGLCEFYSYAKGIIKTGADFLKEVK